MSEDLIRRSDAIDVLYQYQESVEMGIKSFPLAVKAMNDIPTIESKRGEWIDYSCGSGCCCSNCEWDGDDTIDECIIRDFIFCPNCGADMG